MRITARVVEIADGLGAAQRQGWSLRQALAFLIDGLNRPINAGLHPKAFVAPPPILFHRPSIRHFPLFLE